MTSLIPDLRLSTTHVAAISITLASGLIYRYIWSRQPSHISRLHGPSNSHWLWGHIRIILESINDPSIAEEWAEKYGSNVAVDGVLHAKRLWSIDPKTIGYVLARATSYPKPQNSREALEAITGKGVLVVEGDVHKRQRKILNPAFSPAQIREFAPIFMDKAKMLTNAWMSLLTSKGEKEITIDVLHWTGRATLDVIGEAGFGYHFDALVNESNVLSTAISNMFKNMAAVGFMTVLQYYFPLARLIPTRRSRTTKHNQSVIHRIGNRLISEKKQDILQTTSDEQAKILERDLLSVLVKSNVTSQTISEEEILAQITTFVLAGHETTSTALSGFLHAMSTHTEIQDKLREEVFSVNTDSPSTEEINALPYLDRVLRETLRLHSPVTVTSRAATHDDVLPVTTPFVDKDGQTCNEIRVQAGDIIFISLTSLNSSPGLWGPDARVFNPDRWESPPEAISAIPSIFSNLSSFLSGPRACIGWRMAVLEMKVFMFTMIRNFEFKIDPSLHIKKKTVIVSRPYVVGQEKEGDQLPLIVSLCNRGTQT